MTTCKLLEPIGEDPLALTKAQKALCLASNMSTAGLPCSKELHFGFFFDGTNNNRIRDTPQRSQSNVARLYDVFDATPDENARIYVAGVGTPFMAEVGDSGLGAAANAGLGAGWGGEARINWALLQLHDKLFRYFHRGSLSFSESLGTNDQATVKEMSADINMSPGAIRNLGKTEVQMLREVGGLTKMGNIVETAMTSVRDEARSDILRTRRQALWTKLSNMVQQRNPKLEKLCISVFGFSRGAAEARAFCNWLTAALDPDFTLAGIKVEVVFLGIFDTVASVGMAQSFLVKDGHDAWGRPKDLAIPAYVKRCVHLVSGHEVRGSFPLDLATGNGIEVVYPGVHSDVGGGYPPGEQGRGCATGPTLKANDSEKLSQVPLCHMFREAVVAGVPLNPQTPGVTQEMRDAFKVAPALREVFNAYVTATRPLLGDRISTTAAMQTHYGLYLRWRRLRLGPTGAEALEAQDFLKRAKQFKHGQDYTDLTLANAELRDEWKALKKDEDDIWYEETWLGAILRGGLIPVYLADRVWGEKVRQWQDVRRHWNDTAPLPSAVVRLLDDYAHDSRAWFKPMGQTNEATWRAEQADRMTRLEAKDAASKEWERKNRPLLDAAQEAARKGRPVYAPMLSPMPPGLTKQELADLTAYRKDKTLPTEPGPREYSSMWGYLRWRTLYRNGVALTNKERLDLFISAQPPKEPPPMDAEGMRQIMSTKGIGDIFSGMR
ncbi:hypothetical protein CKY39_31695 [Variovorax boronicumulans]|uniref:T6SS Phospholipase effector Tle1-like catalytic domain-containing protein n=1 Tax=Variovorax boronicumulans TaxID=436515 RepID=A0A250DTN0_9BURK|nr:DUF2235 domain-containing protein [Variovorax boronicumulans]ATA57283.1 hypothetical protein CKY39_31695 [Variovorax boronicumulans]